MVRRQLGVPGCDNDRMQNDPRVAARPTKSRAWFDQGCESFKRAFPSLAARIPADSFYVCPICLRIFNEHALTAGVLTREHVPPESLGGHRMVLTCEECNSEGGHSADSHARLEADLIGFVRGEVHDMKANLRTESGRMPVRITAGGGGVLVFGVPKASSKASQDAVQGDFSAATVDGKWQDFKMNVEFPAFSVDRAAASWLRSAYLAFFAALGYRFIYRPELDVVRARIKNPELKEPGSFRIIRPELAPPTLFRIEEPQEFKSFAMAYGYQTIFLPGHKDSEFYARIAKQPRGMVTFTGSEFYWPSNGPTFFFDSGSPIKS